MRDIELLREAWSEPEPPSPAAYHAARSALLRQAAGDRVARKRRPGARRVGWLLGTVVAAATAAAAAIAVLPDPLAPGGGSTPDGSTEVADPTRTGPLTGQELMLAAGLVARSQPTTAGTYWHLKATITFPERVSSWEFWATHDGDVYVHTGMGVVQTQYGDAYHIAGQFLSAAELNDLPTDPEALLSWLEWGLEHPEPSPPVPGMPSLNREPVEISDEELPYWLSTLLGEMLWRHPVPPAVRAAAFEALASLSNVENLGTQDGAWVLRVSYPLPSADKFPGGVLPEGVGEQTLVIDQATSQVRSVTDYQGTMEILLTEWTDEIPPIAAN